MGEATTQRDRDVKRAREIILGSHAGPAEALSLSTRLQAANEFGYARRVLARARKSQDVLHDAALRIKLAQQQALSTYKDPELALDDAIEMALNLLREVEDLTSTRSQETLSIAGAIFKRKWEAESQKQLLERALGFYMRGYKEGVKSDSGNTGINAAFVLDLLAEQEEAEAIKAGIKSEFAHLRRNQARQIREDIVVTLTEMAGGPDREKLLKDYWFIVTMAEALFGLYRFEEAEDWLYRAANLEGVPGWQYQTTACQLARLADLLSGQFGPEVVREQSEAWEAISVFLKGNIAGVRTAFLGRVGLALSGGGFRASLFHIGVLARLAELDMLRHVEALSCVSGGSIIGAHYYLEIRKLLTEKTDEEITRQDYIDLVARVADDFLAGVQRNIRTRVAAEIVTNLKMIFKPGFSRTERVGELYESEIFSRIKDGEGDRPRYLSSLYIFPKGENADFKPKYDNWRRDAKVPILLLNATPLNTGHNWQFTASWMGEPPAKVDNEVDRNYRLRRVYYWEAPEDYARFRLGYAVAASSCVPGLFEPLILDDLYENEEKIEENEGEIRIRLVDGGVHDNQGVSGLLDQGCSVVLVSDASGQMSAQDNPSAGLLGVPLRANSILMARVREAQYLDLVARRRSSLLRGLMFIHLKKDLPVEPVDWIGCEDPHEGPEYDRSPITPYGIRKDIQEELAGVRTDLDSFSDTEAYALMTSGYRMTEYEFDRRIQGFPRVEGDRPNWRFLAVEEPMKDRDGHQRQYEDMKLLLRVARSSAFKIWKISRPLRIAGVVLTIAALALLTWALWEYRNIPVLTVGAIGILIAVAAAAAIFGKMIARVARLRETIGQMVIGTLMTLFGWLAARIHLYIFDRWFLWRGRVVTGEAGSKARKSRGAAAGAN
jgi:predicted acylesterase/phospholipase RssA